MPQIKSGSTTGKSIKNRPPAQQLRVYGSLAVSQFHRFAQTESFSGILLLFCALIALIWANSPWSSAYDDLFHRNLSLGFGTFLLSKSLIHWINDGLMVIFFFVIGLEIKKELLIGELSSVRKALLPAITALGGMLVPALFFVAFNAGKPSSGGWGIPMATDIAFALGILLLAGKRAPMSLKVFLMALAIVDDLGAVLVIALFYTKEIAAVYLYYGLGLYAAMIALNLMGMRITIIYSALGIILWFLFLKSGVHATISGVLLAFVIPAEKTLRYRQFHTQLSDLTGHFGQTFTSIMPTSSIVSRQTRMLLLEELYTVIHHVHSPLERLEHGLKPWTAYLILPIFALANAGVYLSADSLSYFLHPVFWGIFLGLFVGKQIGVFGAGWLAIRMGWATMPSGVTWPMFYSVSILSGIGFTMSLFIADLGLPREYHDVAKVGILTSTILAASIGFLLTKRSSASAPDLSETAPDPYQVLKKLKKNSAITNEAQ